ncbi:unnamed protein product, partial [Allacma fusca]
EFVKVFIGNEGPSHYSDHPGRMTAKPSIQVMLSLYFLFTMALASKTTFRDSNLSPAGFYSDSGRPCPIGRPFKQVCGSAREVSIVPVSVPSAKKAKRQSGTSKLHSHSNHFSLNYVAKRRVAVFTTPRGGRCTSGRVLNGRCMKGRPAKGR